MENVVFTIAGMVPLLAGVFVGQRYGKWQGFATGAAMFVAVTSILVAAGYGY